MPFFNAIVTVLLSRIPDLLNANQGSCEIKYHEQIVKRVDAIPGRH